MKEAEQYDQKDKRETSAFWRKWIDLAKKAAKKHHQDSRRGWAEYDGNDEGISSAFLQPLEKIKDTYPIYWASVKTLEPAFYSRTPKLVSKRKFGIKDPVAMTACTIAERLGQALIESSNFDSVMMAAVGDYIHADKATNQIKYEATLEPQRVEVFPTDETLEVFFDVQGQPVDGEVFQDPQTGGYFVYGGEGVNEDTQKISLVPCSFDEVLHTPDANTEDEIHEKAFHFYMVRSDAEARFKDINPDEIKWKKSKDSDDSDRDHASDLHIESTDEYLEGYECWCKKSKKVYWYSDQYHDLLDVKDDPYELVGFFPSPDFIIGSKPSKTLFPTPVYVRLYPQIRELHKIAERIPTLIDSIRRRAVVDGDEELVLALNSLDTAEYISSKGLTSILEKGGIQNMVWYIPVQELVQSITEMNALTEKFKQEFFEWFGVPDIMRGQAEPMNAAATNEMMMGAAHDRFRYMKKQVQMLARDSIELMVDLALKVYSDQKIAEIVGYQYMNQFEQQRFPQAVQMLRNDKARVIRLDIETDSTTMTNETAELQKMQTISALVSEGIGKVSEIIQIDPALAIVPLNIMLMSLENIAPGRAVMDDIRQQINDMIEEAKQAKANPPPPPPDIEQLKLQMQGQELQLKAQDNQLKAQIEGAKLQREDFKNQLALQKQNADERVQMIQLQQEGYKIQQEQMRVNLEQVVQQFMMQLENMRVQLEFFKARGAANERQLEELRLARQVDNEGRIGLIEALKPPPAPEPKEPPPPAVINLQAPPVNVNVDARRGGRRTGRMITDELGNFTVEMDEMPEGIIG